MIEASENKPRLCVNFIVEKLELRNRNTGNEEPPPFFLGVNGAQGIGKTSLVSHLLMEFSALPDIPPETKLRDRRLCRRPNVVS